jgi:hypothetical protein
LGPIRGADQWNEPKEAGMSYACSQTCLHHLDDATLRTYARKLEADLDAPG